MGGTLSFVRIPNLVGGSDVDTLTVSPRSKVAGKIDGGGGTADTINYANYGAAVTVNLETLAASGTAGFVNIESFVGSVKADNTGAVGATTFAGVGHLTGGTQADTFVLADGAGVSGTIDGGAGKANVLSYAPYTVPITVDLTAFAATNVTGGIANLGSFVGGTSVSDTLLGPNQANVWTVPAANAGKLNAMPFTGFENLIGGTQADAFVFSRGIGVSGQIDGGGGRNRLDYRAYVTPVTVDLPAGTATGTAGVANIQEVTGGTQGDTLTGNDQDNVLLGNGGNDTLTGNDGRDLLFGGDGLDTIWAGLGEDLIANGKTTFDTNWSVLDALRGYWTGGLSFADRTQQLATGTTGIAGLPKLNSSTMTNDKFVDSLWGGGDADWFFAKTTASGQDLLDLLVDVDRVNSRWPE